MEKYIELLNYFIERKKIKKDPNEEERKKYTEAMTEMLKNEGYSASERYLYDGFIYCKAFPLKKYIKNDENSFARIHEFFNGKLYTKNCGITVSILFNLLALYLNEERINVKIVNLIIKKIPAAICNKEGGMFGKAHWALNRHFLKELKCNELPAMNFLVENGLRRNDADDFCFKIAQIVARLEKEKIAKKNREKLEKVKKWIKKQPSIEEKNKIDENNVKEEEAQDESQKSIMEIELEKSKKELLDVKEQLNRAIAIKDSQRDTIINMQTKIKTLNENMLRLDELLNEKNSKIVELSSSCESQLKEIEGLEFEISRKKIELNERTQMMEALSRDREKQTDESLNRLASKLRVEYRDFLDAVDIPMDNDLGENMREQLRNVFNILIKSGVSIND